MSLFVKMINLESQKDIKEFKTATQLKYNPIKTVFQRKKNVSPSEQLFLNGANKGFQNHSFLIWPLDSTLRPRSEGLVR